MRREALELPSSHGHTENITTQGEITSEGNSESG